MNLPLCSHAHGRRRNNYALGILFGTFDNRHDFAPAKRC